MPPFYVKQPAQTITWGQKIDKYFPETRGRGDKKEITGSDVISSGLDESILELLVVNAFPSL